jgi:malate permease and related proteins
MFETLVHAYTPLLLWTGLGVLTLRFLPQTLPRLLGRSLYWIGVPWQIFALARYTNFADRVEIVPIVTLSTLAIGILLAWGALQGITWLQSQPSLPESAIEGAALPTAIGTWLPPLSPAQKGSFVLVTVLGNTGFVGLGLLPAIISPEHMGWAIFFSMTQNVVGTYGIGVLIASYFGHPGASEQPNRWWIQLRDILTVPTLWAFVIGYLTQSLSFPPLAETVCHASLLFVIPASFLLMGMRLSQLEGIKSLQSALIPSFLKVVVLPGTIAIATTLLGLSGDPRLALVLMAGMPSAFASLILAEEYNLDHDISASSIALTTIGLLLMIPIWLAILQ